MTTATRYDASNNLPPSVLEAERDYHDCLARFGHASGEAHAAEVHWRRLRSDASRSLGTAS